MSAIRLRCVAGGLATAVYLVLLLVVYYVHARFFRVDVVFYSALLDALLAAVAALALVLTVGRFRVLDAFDRIQLFAIWLLLGYAWAISVPTVIDRSLSFYILEKLEQRGGSLRLDQFEQVFTRDYAREHRLVDVRLTEQASSGTVVISGDCVSLTSRGRTLARFSRFFRQHLLPKHRLLMGEYTDRLTDPFRGQPRTMSNGCGPEAK